MSKLFETNIRSYFVLSDGRVLDFDWIENICDVCRYPVIIQRNCKLICANCKTILKTCSDL